MIQACAASKVQHTVVSDAERRPRVALHLEDEAVRARISGNR